MSNLKSPKLADWMRWEPEIRAIYKKVTAEYICRKMADKGLRVT
jgi:hypothetical protein